MCSPVSLPIDTYISISCTFNVGGGGVWLWYIHGPIQTRHGNGLSDLVSLLHERFLCSFGRRKGGVEGDEQTKEERKTFQHLGRRYVQQQPTTKSSKWMLRVGDLAKFPVGEICRVQGGRMVWLGTIRFDECMSLMVYYLGDYH